MPTQSNLSCRLPAGKAFMLTVIQLALAAWVLGAENEDSAWKLDEPLPTGGRLLPSESDLFGTAPKPATPLDSAPLELLQMVNDAWLNPFAEEVPAEEAPPDERLIDLARRISPKVVSLRAWDAYGEELSRGCGFFISVEGALATDISIVHPDFAARIEYVTVTTGDGRNFRVAGVHGYDLKSGLAILQTDAKVVEIMPLDPKADFSKERPVKILSFTESRGLRLAPAFAKPDASPSGSGWLNLHGADSPGEPGSPILNEKGEIVGLVSMRVPQRNWFNFGISATALAEALQSGVTKKVQPLRRLALEGTFNAARDTRFVAAFENLYAGRTRSAIADLLFLRKIYPRSAEVWAVLGLACREVGANQEALNCHRKAVALNADAAPYWQQLGMSYLRSAQPKDRLGAIEAFQHTVESRPADAASWLLLARRQLAEDHFATADRSLEQVIKLNPDYAPALFLMAYTKGKVGDYQAAELAAKNCVAVDRKHARAWYYLGLLYTKMKRDREALEALRTVVDLEPAHPNAWMNLAVLHKRLGKSTEAGLALSQHQRIRSGRK